MKKTISVIAALIILSLALTACTPKEYEAVNAKEYGCFHYPGVEWGITEEQLYEALGKTAEDFEREEAEKTSHILNLTTKVEFLEKDCVTTFSFVGVPDSNLMPLEKVEVQYELGEVTYQEFVVKVSELVKLQNEDYEIISDPSGVDSDVDRYEFSEKKTTADLPQEIKDGYNNYMYHLYDTGILPTMNDKDKERCMNTDYAKANSSSLSKVKIIHFPEDNVCTVTFDGSGLVLPLSCAEAYAQLNN